MNRHELAQGISMQRPAPLKTIKTSPAAVHRSAARSTWIPSPATGSLTCWTSGRPSGDGTCGGACAVPQNVRRDQREHTPPLEAERATSSATWQEKHADGRRHDAAQRAHHEGDRRAVLECGHDPWPGARMARGGGKRWVKKLLRGMRLSYKKPAKCLKELHSPEQQHANTHRLFIKLCWLMDKHAVSADRVINIDKTLCRLLPGASDRIAGPAAGQHQGGHDIHDRLQHGPWPTRHAGADRARGHDRRRLAPSPGRSALTTSLRRTGWATTTTILQLAAALDNVLNPGREGQSWIFLWDMASIHASEATLTAMRATFPHVVLCFLPPQSTSYLQPCDVAVFRSFKSCIQTQASATLARSVLDGSFDGLAMNKAWRRQSSAEWASRALMDLCEKNQAWTTCWRRLRADSDDGFRDAATEAAALHARDDLFPKHIELEPAPEDPVEWAMAEATDGEDDAPMPDAPA